MEIIQFVAGFDPKALKGSTVIVPAVSLGNVPQLAVDLLLHNLQFKKVGSLNDTYVYPFASPIDHLKSQDGVPGISTAIEVYFSEQNNLTLVQQRSPIIPSYTQTFSEKVVVPFVEKYEFDGIVVLDSGDAGLLEQVAPGAIETFTNEDILSKSIESLSISDKVHTIENNYHYSKFVKHTIERLTSSMKVTVYVIFVYEGENFHEGTLLADKVRTKLELEQKTWEPPVSWSGVYGDKPIPTSMEEGIYG